MNRPIWWAVLVLVWAALGVGAYYWWQQQRGGEPPKPAPVATAPTPPAVPPAPAEPETRYPIEEARPEGTEESAQDAAPLPPLAESDKTALQALTALVGRKALDAFFMDTRVVHRVVATVDGLPRKKVSTQVWPVKPTDGRFTPSERGGAFYLGPENDRRYEPLLRVVESVDTGTLVAVYVRLYPLFQQAYNELGYPNRHFNDRLIEVIDHLLATPELRGPVKLVPPEVKGPVKLERPWIMYEFADPDLAERSAGQKTMLRIGAGNAGVVKAKLRDIRRQLTRRGATP
jgi:hypothetical protein